jgi:hypothetical protein
MTLFPQKAGTINDSGSNFECGHGCPADSKTLQVNWNPFVLPALNLMKGFVKGMFFNPFTLPVLSVSKGMD